MMLRKPVEVTVRVACKALILATLCAGVLVALSTGPAAARTRVTIGIGIGVPLYHDGWRHGYYGHHGYYPHYRRYGHFRGYGGYGNYDRGYYGYPAPVVVAPYPGVYPAPVYPGSVYPGSAYSAPVYSAPAYGAGVPSYCREFRTTINVNGTLQPAWGTACLQPDGTWRFVQ